MVEAVRIRGEEKTWKAVSAGFLRRVTFQRDLNRSARRDQASARQDTEKAAHLRAVVSCFADSVEVVVGVCSGLKEDVGGRKSVLCYFTV